MRLRYRLFIVLALLAAAPLAIGGIAGGKHDFSGATWAGDRICEPCHTPHGADTSVADSPLWNHDVTTASFTLYSSPWLDQTPNQPQSVSKLCLSCHDGTIALDAYGGQSGSTFIGGGAKIGTDLSDDHPVSIKWKHQTEASNCSDCHGGHGGGGFTSVLPFFSGYVECATCHDVHDSGYASMLRLPMAASELCFYCHGK